MSRPAQGRAGTDARAAISELLNELDNTRKEYAKASIQLSQLDAALQAAKDLHLEKDAAIGRLEDELRTCKDEHRAQMQDAEERHKTRDAALSHRARHLELEVARLQTENELMNKVEADNRTLRETILDNQSTIDKLQLVNTDLRGRTRDGGGRSYEDMEREFQKKLAAAEKRFRAEAYRALSEEAKIALQGNDHLQLVLKRQNDSIETVLSRCKQLEQSHGAMQDQQDRSAAELQHHLREIARLSRALEETRSKNDQLQDSMKQRRVERASLELLFVEYESTRKRLTKADEKARRAVREAERWKSRAVQLTQELSDEQRNAAEERLLKLQSMSDTINANATREEHRSILRGKLRQQNAQGATALLSMRPGDDRPMSQTLDSPDGDGSVASALGALAEGGSGVSAVDILSIWSRQGDDGFDRNPSPTTASAALQLLETMKNENGGAGQSPLALPAPPPASLPEERSPLKASGPSASHRQPRPLPLTTTPKPPPPLKKTLTVDETIAMRNAQLSLGAPHGRSAPSHRGLAPGHVFSSKRLGTPTRSGSALSSREPLHTVTDDGSVRLVGCALHASTVAKQEALAKGIIAP